MVVIVVDEVCDGKVFVVYEVIIFVCFDVEIGVLLGVVIDGIWIGFDVELDIGDVVGFVISDVFLL